MKKFTYRENILVLIIVILLSAGGYAYHEINGFDDTKYLTILHTNDVHGRLEPFKYGKNKDLTGGMARRATLIKKIESSNKNVITVDAGDIAQGSLFFNIFNGTPDVKLMHSAGYDIATLGNHEFDKGLSVTKEIVKHSGFPFVSANLVFTEDKELQEMVKPYIIRNYNGLDVAFIGLIAENLKTLVNNLKNVEVLDSIETTKAIIKDINLQADLIVVISHMGVSADIELAKSIPEIDVIIGGHSHTLLSYPKIFNKNSDKTLVVQGGEFGAHLGRLDIAIKDKEIKNYYYNLIPVDFKIKPDPVIQEKIAVLAREIEKYKTKKVGELTVSIGDEGHNARTALVKQGNLVTKAIKYRFPEVDAVLQNAGGLRLQRTITPGGLTSADVLEIYPFENTIITLELKGRDLKSVLETSSRFYPRENGGFLQSIGLEYTINKDNSPQLIADDGLTIIKPGNRVSEVKVNGSELENDKYYKIALNNYMFNGGNGYSQFKNSVNAVDSGILVQDAIVEFMENNSPVSLEVRDKIHIN